MHSRLESQLVAYVRQKWFRYHDGLSIKQNDIPNNIFIDVYRMFYSEMKFQDNKIQRIAFKVLLPD